jgi:hypothetical protein
MISQKFKKFVLTIDFLKGYSFQNGNGFGRLLKLEKEAGNKGRE